MARGHNVEQTRSSECFWGLVVRASASHEIDENHYRINKKQALIHQPPLVEPPFVSLEIVQQMTNNNRTV